MKETPVEAKTLQLYLLIKYTINRLLLYTIYWPEAIWLMPLKRQLFPAHKISREMQLIGEALFHAFYNYIAHLESRKYYSMLVRGPLLYCAPMEIRDIDGRGALSCSRLSAAKTLLRAPRPSKSCISIDKQYNLRPCWPWNRRPTRSSTKCRAHRIGPDFPKLPL